GDDGGQLGGDLALAHQGGAEGQAAGDIDGEDDGTFALLDVAFDEGLAHAGGDVPVDGADVVAGLVGADLLEGDAGALEDGVVLAAQQVLDGATGLELEATDLAEDLAGQHDRTFLGRSLFPSRGRGRRSISHCQPLPACPAGIGGGKESASAPHSKPHWSSY